MRQIWRKRSLPKRKSLILHSRCFPRTTMGRTLALHLPPLTGSRLTNTWQICSQTAIIPHHQYLNHKRNQTCPGNNIHSRHKLLPNPISLHDHLKALRLCRISKPQLLRTTSSIKQPPREMFNLNLTFQQPKGHLSKQIRSMYRLQTKYICTLIYKCNRPPQTRELLLPRTKMGAQLRRVNLRVVP
jgi:hypothetical protein